jgi:uncharacterized protein
MKKITLLSDSHGFVDEAIKKHCHSADEVWHAGDVGAYNPEKELAGKGITLRGVCGNIDGPPVRGMFPEFAQFECEGFSVLILHIGGKPGSYSPRALQLIREIKPGIFVTGHSHICRVEYDKKENFLYINPGACGREGFHPVRTLITFCLDRGKISEFKIVELGKR